LNNIVKSLKPLIVPIDSVRPDPQNARKHPERNLETIKKSLNTYGQRKPIVVNHNDIIEAGNGLWQAAKELGWAEIAVVKVQDDEDYAKAYGIMDNQSALLADWDLPTLKDLLEELDTGAFDMEATGFDESEIEDLMTQCHVPEEGLTDDDAVPEPTESKSVKGDLWSLGNHRLLCGDATVITDVERLMGGEKADMVFTDPPYGIDYSGGRTQVVKHKTYGKIQGDAEQDISYFIEAILSIDASDKWVCCSPVNLPPALRPFDTIGGVNAIVVWDKGRPGLGYQWIRRQCEFILFSTKRQKHKEDKSELDLWSISVDAGKDYQHGTQKPVALAERAINYSSKVKDIVLDPYGGSGFTLIACEKLDRRCCMIEIAPHYCDVIIERWQNYTGKKAVKL